jgi:pyruvate ferredoxin oxidoreductase delta subunit
MKIDYACVVPPRTSLANKTGSWRFSRPVLDATACSGCGLCDLYCPEGCVLPTDKKYRIDYDYCKGCGICAHECPSGAIQMQAEEA